MYRELAGLNKDELIKVYKNTRSNIEDLCTNLENSDFNLQAMQDTSPAKWHLAHVSWFYEEFILKVFVADYKCFSEDFSFLFNSYYEGVGKMQKRSERHLISRPSVDEVFSYRRHIDDHICKNIETITSLKEAMKRFEIGINHEEQHTELLLTDLKYNFYKNPLQPSVLNEASYFLSAQSTPLEWINMPEGIYDIGADNKQFCFDNETSAHRVFLESYALANRLVTNADFIEFIEDDAYSRPELWLSEGISWCRENNIELPLYWKKDGKDYLSYNLNGWQKVDLNAPVCHVNYFEADAFANWSGHRLPTEFEWEAFAKKTAYLGGSFLSNSASPSRKSSQDLGLYGEVWQWTSSSYAPYPRHKKEQGALGEYNAKFMCNQYVLRGASIATPMEHFRLSYRNFFPSHTRWQFTGLRLAKSN